MAPKAPENLPQTGPLDHELAMIVERWGELPEPMRAGIVAILRVANGE